jgi:hypothetical protein
MEEFHMNLSLSDVDFQAARERYNDELRQARLLRLIRAGQGLREVSSRPARPRSLISRVLAALSARGPARAWRFGR